jgi:hypothetical protein
MAPATDNPAEIVEIACDESGYEGQKLFGGTTEVFAHASVALSEEAATDCILDLRRRIQSPAQEYKANHLLREKHRSILVWILGASGPTFGTSRVLLVEKSYSLIRVFVDLLARGPGQGAEVDSMARTLHSDGGVTFGTESWGAFLTALNDMLRARDSRSFAEEAETFYQSAAALGFERRRGTSAGIMSLLWSNESTAIWRDLNGSMRTPVLDPLLPAIAGAVAHWRGTKTSVSVIHDRQNSLTRGRIAVLEESLSEPPIVTTVRLVDSRSDPRVQIADFLAGVARKIAEEELKGRGDPELSALLTPYIDPLSIWGDGRSWSALGGNQ